MIENGEIFATINQKDGMVSFKENPEGYNTNTVLNYLDKQIHQTMDVTKKVEKLDEQISLNTKYLAKTVAPERGSGGSMSVMGRFGPGDFEDFDGMDKPGMHPGFRG